MHTLPGVRTATPRRRSVTPDLLVVLGFVWAALTLLASPAGQPEAAEPDDIFPRTGAIVAPNVLVGPRPLLLPVGNAPAARATFITIDDEPVSDHALRRPPAERTEPHPSLFDRFSYRTTGPPPRNG